MREENVSEGEVVPRIAWKKRALVVVVRISNRGVRHARGKSTR